MDSPPISYHNKFACIHDENYSWNQRYKDRYCTLKSLIEKYFKKDDIILDLGCGSGIFSEVIANQSTHVLAVDGSDRMLEIFNRRMKEPSMMNKVSLIKGLIPEILENPVFSRVDGIFASSIAEYINDLEGLLNILFEKLSNGGFLIVSMPNKVSVFRLIHRFAYFFTKRPLYYRYIVNYLSENSMRALLEKFGFKIIEYQYFSIPKFFKKFINVLDKSRISNMYVIVCQKST